MKKIMLVAMMLVAMLSFAQEKKFGLDAAGEFAMPMGDFGDTAGMGFGATLKGYYPINEQIDATLRLGYLTFMQHEDLDGLDDATWSQIPILVGGRYKMPNNFYGLFELGMTKIAFKMEIDMGILGTIEYEYDEMDLTYAVGAGYMMDQFDFSVFYNSVMAEDDALNHLGIRVGYKFM